MDKDRASALLAARIDLDTLVLVTGVDQVYIGFGTPHQQALSQVSADQARAHLAAGEFPAGSMGPEVEDAALQFLDGGGRRAIITSISCLPDALRSSAGTHILAGTASPGTEPTTPATPPQEDHP